MPWINNEFIYTKRILQAIAENYTDIYMSIYYSGGEIHEGIVVNPLIDYKIDFDMALNSIGAGHWVGDVEKTKFENYRYFGKLQRVVIADIYGITNWELERLGFYRIPNLKSIAYGRMVRCLNDGS